MARSKQGETKAATTGGPPEHLAERLAGSLPPFRPAPVHLWNPPLTGRIDIRIDRDGGWHHEGDPILREGLVRLFASVLRREADGSYMLVTPVEKVAIEVADVPFLAVDLSASPSGPPLITFRTNLGEEVALDAHHPLRIDDAGGDAFIPYVTVRPGLEARLTRAVAEDLAGLAVARAGRLGVESGGQFFVIGPLP